MTPVASWSPADYYRASRRARALCMARDEQLVLTVPVDALEEAEITRMSASSSAPDVRVGAGLPSSSGSRREGALDLHHNKRPRPHV